MTEVMLTVMVLMFASGLMFVAYQMGKQDGWREGSEYAHMMALDKVHDLSRMLDEVVG
jgi:hypothetical protein